jgi:hypothetical protein
MYAILLNKGPWKKVSKETDLIHEDCPEGCGTFFYAPEFLVNPICKKCDKLLIGFDLVKDVKARIAFHLEK